jgi:hypothetical protein
VERPTIAETLAAARREEFGFHFLRLGESKFGRDGNVGIELWIDLLDPAEHELGEFNGRELSLPKEFSDLFDGSESEIGIVRAQNIFS